MKRKTCYGWKVICDAKPNQGGVYCDECERKMPASAAPSVAAAKSIYDSTMADLPENLRDPRAVLERGGMLNKLLEQRNEMARLLRYLLDHSHARALLSDAYIEDVKTTLVSPQSRGHDPYFFDLFKSSFADHSDPHRDATEYDWLNGWGKLWRDAIDAERSQSTSKGVTSEGA